MAKKCTKMVWSTCKVVVFLIKLIALFMMFSFLLLLSYLRVPILFCTNIWLDPPSLAVQLITSPKRIVDRYIHKSIYMEIDTWWSNLKEILVRCVIIYVNLQLGSWMLVFTIKNIKKTVTLALLCNKIIRTTGCS